MKSLVVTGGIGCGKSWVVSHLENNIGSVYKFDCDACVAELYKQTEVRERIGEIVGSNFTRDRDFMEVVAVAIYTSPSKREEVEGVLHPKVKEAYISEQRLAREQNLKVFIAEIPLFYEGSMRYENDEVIVVASSGKTQLERLKTRGLSKDRAERIIAAQLPLEYKLARASYVLWNNGSKEVAGRQLDLLIDKYSIG